MAKVFVPKVVSANRLGDGVVVFLDGRGGWVEDFQASAVLATAETEAAGLTEGAKAMAQNHVVDVYSFDVEGSSPDLRALTLRDSIRAAGPTIRPLTHVDAFNKPASTKRS
jgi:hypothetical protein